MNRNRSRSSLKMLGLPVGLLVGLVLLAVYLFTCQLAARRLPTYQAMLNQVAELWDARYPLKADSFQANPEKLGILSTRHKGRAVYYYHFHASLKRPVRKKDESLGYAENPRKVEFWVRYRPGLAKPYDLSFARRDLLPGTGRRWTKSR